MFGPCPVVRIKYDNEEGFCEINESDFDAAKHELFDAVDQDADHDADNAMTVAEMRKLLAGAGVAIPAGAKKAELKALIANLQ